MNYFIFLVFLVLLIFWVFRRPKVKSEFGLQKEFKLKPEEDVIEQWEIYIALYSDKNFVDGFFEGGKIYNFLRTSQNRLILKTSEPRIFIFDPQHLPQFEATSKKPTLRFFARIASAKVLKVTFLDHPFDPMEWHVPNEFPFD